MPTDVLERTEIAGQVSFWEDFSFEPANDRKCERLDHDCPNVAVIKVKWSLCPWHGYATKLYCKSCFDELMEDDERPIWCYEEGTCEEEVVAIYTEWLK